MANEISSISQEGNSEISLVLEDKQSLSNIIRDTSSEISANFQDIKSTIESVYDEKTSEILTQIVSEPTEIIVSLSDSPTEIQTSIEESSEIVTYINQAPTEIKVSVEKSSTPIQVVTEYLAEPVLSVRVRGDERGPQTGDVVLDPSSIPHFHSETYYEQGDIVIYDYRFYEAKENFVSGASFNQDDWIPIASEITISSEDESVDITTEGTTVDLSVSRIVEAEKVRAEEVEQQLASLIQALGLRIKQSDWNEQNDEDEAYIKNKPTKLSEFENDENFVKASEVYKKSDIVNQPTVITLDDATIKTYDILTLGN